MNIPGLSEGSPGMLYSLTYEPNDSVEKPSD